ncbi:Uncharacterised protein [Serratia fonticola]|uniref:Uncharacterized protein n=1 Tax=Serratia fonticola TaxID=47917 RepID=A0A4U9V233_SERFO|nr:Uncharacterised protein [Serratia fonticola]
MKVKYLIYFFTFAIMLSFAVFIANGLIKARTSYEQSLENLYKISRTKEVAEAFQATLLAHRLKRLGLADKSVTQAEWQQADKQARDKIAIVKSQCRCRSRPAPGHSAKDCHTFYARLDGKAAG